MYKPKTDRVKKAQENILAYMVKRMGEGADTSVIYTELHESTGYSEDRLKHLAPIHAAQALIDKEQPASQEAAA